MSPLYEYKMIADIGELGKAPHFTRIQYVEWYMTKNGD